MTRTSNDTPQMDKRKLDLTGAPQDNLALKAREQ